MIGGMWAYALVEVNYSNLNYRGQRKQLSHVCYTPKEQVKVPVWDLAPTLQSTHPMWDSSHI